MQKLKYLQCIQAVSLIINYGMATQDVKVDKAAGDHKKETLHMYS